MCAWWARWDARRRNLAVSELHRERGAGGLLPLAAVLVLALAGTVWFLEGVRAPRATAARAAESTQAAPPVAVAERPLQAAHAPSGEPSPATLDPWEQVPLDRDWGRSIGSPSIGRAFAEAMPRMLGLLLACRKEWVAPPGITQVMMEMELRVRSREGSLVVEDVAFPGGSVGDADLERCLARDYRGRRVEAPGIEPGRAFRFHQVLYFNTQ